MKTGYTGYKVQLYFKGKKQMQTKKRAVWVILFFTMTLAVSAAGCKKKEKTAERPIQEAWTVYHPENVQAYTLDEEGNLYTLELPVFWDDVDEYGTPRMEFYLNRYDKEGNQVFSRRLKDELRSSAVAMTVKDGILYFAPAMYEENKICAVLHSYNIETEELTKVKAFPYYERVNRILVGEDRIYLIGAKTGIVSRRSDSYSYAGEKIMYYMPSTGEVFELGIPEPIDIAFDGEGNLVVYAHTEDGFCFFSYDAGRDAIKTIAKTDIYKMYSIALGSQGGEVLYQTLRGLVLSAFSELEAESELYPDGFFWDNSLCCVNGRVACMTNQREIVQFSLADVKRENKVIRYIAYGAEPVEPYGCGYKMQRTKMDERDADKFALKIMALDKDFDLCLVNTRDSFSYNLKQNGVFYPLNDVPGVREYLDECFPYVREAATDKDGNIWMLPIEVEIPGLAGDEKRLSQTAFKRNMTWQEYFAAQTTLSKEEQSLTRTPYIALLRQFLQQYFYEYNSVDTKQFREILSLFSIHLDCLTGERSSDSAAYLYEYISRGDRDYHAYYLTLLSDNLLLYEMPKLSADGKDIGACLFLAVNPHSDNLEATLDYISSWISYIRNQEKKPLFFANREVGENEYEVSLYELYQNGEIAFMLDSDIWTGYADVLEDITKLEDYITETERKLKIYLNE